MSLYNLLANEDEVYEHQFLMADSVKLLPGELMHTLMPMHLKYILIFSKPKACLNSQFEICLMMQRIKLQQQFGA